MSFMKYRVIEIISGISEEDTYMQRKVEVRCVSESGYLAEYFLFSDEHNLESVNVGYVFVC